MDYFLRHYWNCFNIASVLWVFFFGPKACGIFSSPIRDQTCTPCIESWRFNHWTTREVSLNFLNFKIFHMKRIKNKIIFTSLLFRLNIWLYLLQTEGHLYRHGWKSPAPFNLLPPERFDPWVGLIPWRRAWQPTLVFLPGEYHGQRSLAGYSPWGCKESDDWRELV